jgi:hypothetical protein
MLFYGVDTSRTEVFVFERTEGGQGIVDLVYDELEINPGNVLSAMNQTVFNPQVLNERLWATSDVVESVPTDSTLDTEAAIQIVDESVTVPYPDIIDRIVQEFITTADRCVQLAETVESLEVADAHAIKHAIATAQLDGESEFPIDRVRSLDLPVAVEDIEDTVKSMFVSPDIDGCVENLHLAECISGHGQEESLSHVLLEQLYAHLITTVPAEEGPAQMFGHEQLPAAEIDGTNVFVTF